MFDYINYRTISAYRVTYIGSVFTCISVPMCSVDQIQQTIGLAPAISSRTLHVYIRSLITRRDWRRIQTGSLKCHRYTLCRSGSFHMEFLKRVQFCLDWDISCLLVKQHVGLTHFICLFKHIVLFFILFFLLDKFDFV